MKRSPSATLLQIILCWSNLETIFGFKNTLAWIDNLFILSDDHDDGIMLWLQVKEPWQWLGLDVRGPLPTTLIGHRYILTLTDYYTKWVEAVPLQLCQPENVTKQIVDIIAHFGYPVRILSRLPLDVVQKVSSCH